MLSASHFSERNPWNSQHTPPVVPRSHRPPTKPLSWEEATTSKPGINMCIAPASCTSCNLWYVGVVHPGRVTWNIIIEVWKIIFLSKWVICRFHVNLPGCMLYHPVKKKAVFAGCWIRILNIFLGCKGSEARFLLRIDMAVEQFLSQKWSIKSF